MAGDGSSPRVGTTERTDAQHALDAHLNAGRLNTDEYADRYAAASIAMTAADLKVLFDDLPGPHPKLPRTPGSGPGKPSRRGVIVAAAAVVVVLVGLVVVAGVTRRSDLSAPLATGLPAIPTTTTDALPTASLAPSSVSSIEDPSTTAPASGTGLPDSAAYLISNDPVDRDNADEEASSDTGTYKANGVQYGHAITMGVGCGTNDGGDYWLDYDLSRQWSTFNTTVGIGDDSPADSKATYTVLLDSKVVATGALSLGSAVPLAISAKNALRLRLKMNNPAAEASSCSNSRSTQVVWGDPQLIP